ncbi:hypothetical protein L1987_52212 [Smallanthus sonchifolius]|uniref:Uncharacterized protein n=1 Tax=Smallanthus sonchifolius TaxID=185202 RepID=A0ACB9ESJ6_9ASTR|nr:hypothetical protein L1987_52212 [Smallanthus sonchifolius]
MKALLEEEANKLAIEDEIEDQRGKLKTTTPMTTDLFMEWKRKVEERESGLAAQRAERATNGRMSGRELFLSDASVFVDDAEAYEKYNREEEPADNSINKARDGSSTGGPSSSTSVAAVSEEGNSDIDDDDDDLDMDELNQLEASLSKISIHIQEPTE